VNFTAAVTTVATMEATIFTGQALAADIFDPTTQADTTADITAVDTTVAADIMVAAVTVMVVAVTAVAEIITSLHSPEVQSKSELR
jgi:hypothetical protein